MPNFTNHIIYKLIVLIIVMPLNGYIISTNVIFGIILIAFQIPKIIEWVTE